MDLEQRFWSKVDASGPCWLWTAAIGKTGGYGKYTTRSEGKTKYVYAHRHAWTTLVGEVPEGMDLDHLCRVRRCVNPDHLEPVSRKVNLTRGATLIAENIAKTHCPSGHEYSEENTYTSAAGHRACKVCRREYDKRRRPRKAGD